MGVKNMCKGYLINTLLLKKEFILWVRQVKNPQFSWVQSTKKRMLKPLLQMK